MIALGANFDHLDEVRCCLSPQITAANSWKRIFQHNFRKRVQIGLAAPHDGNFSFKKQIQLSGKWAFRASRTLGDGLNATERFCAPRHDQARIAEFSLAQQDGSRGLHGEIVMRIFARRYESVLRMVMRKRCEDTSHSKSTSCEI